MKDFFKFLEEEDKKVSKCKEEPCEKPMAKEEPSKEVPAEESKPLAKKEEKKAKEKTIKESLAYDDEFNKWIAMSDKIQGIVTDVDAITGKVKKYSDNLSGQINEYSPATGVAAAAPAGTQPANPAGVAPVAPNAQQPTVQQSGKPPMDYNAALRVFKTNPAVASGLSANPALKPLADFLAKHVQ